MFAPYIECFDVDSGRKNIPGLIQEQVSDKINFFPLTGRLFLSTENQRTCLLLVPKNLSYPPTVEYDILKTQKLIVLKSIFTKPNHKLNLARSLPFLN